jgi:hypothetical protein
LKNECFPIGRETKDYRKSVVIQKEKLQITNIMTWLGIEHGDT